MAAPNRVGSSDSGYSCSTSSLISTSRPFGIDDSLARVAVQNESEKARGTFILYDRKDNFLAFGVDAQLLAERVFQTQSVLRIMSYRDTRTPVVFVSDKQYLRVVRDVLLVHQRRLEQWRPSSPGGWAAYLKGSAGNLGQFEELLANEEGAPCVDAAGGGRLLAVSVHSQGGEQHVALACIDLTHFTLAVDEFVDSPHFTNLESTLVQLSPHECVVAAGSTENKGTDHPLKSVLERSDTLVTFVKPSDFKSPDVTRDLDWLLRLRVRGAPQSAAQCPETSLEGAMCCVGALFSYLMLKSDAQYESKFTMRRMSTDAFMRLDSNAVRALELFQTNYLDKGKGSLYALLNRCRTAGGQRMLSQWIRQPLIDKAKIEERLDVVCALMAADVVRVRLHDELLRCVPDLPRLLKRIVKGRASGASLADCYKLFTVVNILPGLQQALVSLVEYNEAAATQSSIRELVLSPIEETQRALRKYGELIESVIDFNHLDQTKEFRVQPHCVPGLAELAAQLDELKREMDGFLNKTAAALGLEARKSIKLDLLAGDGDNAGYYYRITKRDEACLRKHSGFTVLDATRGGVRFSDNRLRRLNGQLVEARQQYDKLQGEFVHQDIYRVRDCPKVLELSAGYFSPVRRCADTLSSLDVLVALAVNATHAPAEYVRPTVLDSDQGKLELLGCRHACMEALPGVDFISNDLSVAKDSNSTVIITGANMGGKSTLLRSVGLCLLMAQIGSPVPASSATISIRDAIHTRVGAADCELRGMSTFMAEMVDCAVLLEGATQRSLVLVDELGRGTSTYDGFGLAAMITERIASLGCLSFVATHFHELSLLAHASPAVRNMHMAAAVLDGQLTMLYKLEPGACDQSFGIHVAKAVGFPENVIKDAEQMLAELEQHGSDVDREISSTADLARLSRLARIDPTALRRQIESI